MQSIKQIARLNQAELDASVAPSASWHTDYRDTAYIHIGGLDTRLSEGDALTIFSQYGDISWVKLARDRETGKSRGFGWVKYEDQRSCDLAVDNLSGVNVLGRVLSVDHARYKKGKDEDLNEGYVGQEPLKGKDAGKVQGLREESSEEDEEESRPLIKEERELAKMLEGGDEDDPMRAYMIEQKREEVKLALDRMIKEGGEKGRDSKRGDKHRSSRRHREREDDDRDTEKHRHRRGSRERDDTSRRDRSRSPARRD